MKIELDELQREKMAIVLNYEIKKDFLKETNAKSMKQLNFFLKNDEKEQRHFEHFAKKHKLYETLEAIDQGASEVPKSGQIAYKTLKSKAIEYAEKDEKRKKIKYKSTGNSEKNSAVLDNVKEYYVDIIRKHQKGEFKEQYQKPWLSDNFVSIPKNISGYLYNLANAEILLEAQRKNNLPVAVFMTSSDLKKINIEPETLIPMAHIIQKGVFYSKTDENNRKITLYDNEYKKLSKEQQLEYEEIFFNKPVPLYHPEQLKAVSIPLYKQVRDSIDEYEQYDKLKSDPQYAKHFYDEQMRKALEIMFSYAAQENIEIEPMADMCAYSPSFDQIKMVSDKQFYESAEYIGTLAHELCHSTGHESRLKRKMTGKFGSPNYGYEELVAETGSRYLLANFNLPSALDEKSASYITNCIDSLKGTENKKVGLFNSACKQGQEASELIVRKGYEYKLENEHDMSKVVELSSKVMANSLTLDGAEEQFDAENPLQVDLSDAPKDLSFEAMKKIERSKMQIEKAREMLRKKTVRPETPKIK